jgi:hypothetical protein
VDPRVGPDEVKKNFLTQLGLEIRPLGRSARSPSLYRLHYRGSSDRWYLQENNGISFICNVFAPILLNEPKLVTGETNKQTFVL